MSDIAERNVPFRLIAYSRRNIETGAKPFTIPYAMSRSTAKVYIQQMKLRQLHDGQRNLTTRACAEIIACMKKMSNGKGPKIKDRIFQSSLPHNCSFNNPVSAVSDRAKAFAAWGTE